MSPQTQPDVAPPVLAPAKQADVHAELAPANQAEVHAELAPAKQAEAHVKLAPAKQAEVHAELTPVQPLPSDNDNVKLRFIHGTDWEKVPKDIRNLVNSVETTISDGQLIVLDNVPTDSKKDIGLYRHLFLTTLAMHATEGVRHAKRHGSVILSKSAANSGTLPIFRLQHEKLESTTIINTATYKEDAQHNMWHCSFPRG